MGIRSDQHRTCSGSEPRTQTEVAELGSGNAVRCSSSGKSSPSRRLLLLQSSPTAASKPQLPEAITDDESEEQTKGVREVDEMVPRVRIGREYQVVLPQRGEEFDHGREPRQPTLLYAPGGTSLPSGPPGSGQISGNDPMSARDASGAAGSSLLAHCFFLFPLPPTRPSSAVGRPAGSTLHDVVEEKQLRWQLERLGFTHHAEILPAALRRAPRGGDWSAQERRAFDECLSRHGKRFREMVPELPGRTVAELVEAYYKFKTHKRFSQIDATQATRNVRQGTCGECPPRKTSPVPEPRRGPSSSIIMLTSHCQPCRDDWMPPARQASRPARL
jgi:hypothetical protein